MDALITRSTMLLMLYPKRTLLCVVIFVLLLMAGAKNLGFSNDYRVYFGSENPQLTAFEKQQAIYTQNENIFVVVTPRDGDIFQVEVLNAIRELTASAWKIPNLLRVDSVTNFSHSYARMDDLVTEPLLGVNDEISDAKIALIREVVLNDPRVHKLLVNEQGTITAVNLQFQLPANSIEAQPKIIEQIKALQTSIEAKYPVDIRLTGQVMLSGAFFEASMDDMGTLVPLMYLVITIICYVLLRSIVATVATMVVVFLSMLASMGAAGYLGLKINPVSSTAPIIISTLAVADCIHVISGVTKALQRGALKVDAIAESIRLNAFPIALTSLTTAVGFLSLNFSDSPPFHDLGNLTAIGVLIAMLLAYTILPICLLLFPFKAKATAKAAGTNITQLTGWAMANKRWFLPLNLLLSFLICAAIPLNELDDRFVEYFDESIEFREATDYTQENLTGVYQVQFSLDSIEEYGITQPEFMASVEAFTQWLRVQPEVIQVASVSDTLKHINKVMANNSEQAYRLPQEEDVLAQYLLLYEMSLPIGMDLNNQLNISRSSTQVTATVRNLSSSDLIRFSQRAEGWLKESQNLDSLGVGPVVMFAYISERNIKAMLWGTGIAIILISAIIFIALRSAKIAIISVVSNLLPIALTFGLWGLFVGEVNMAASVLAGAVLGIVVDDTVHFFSKYLLARREEGKDCASAIISSFSYVGRPIIVTSLVLIAGFCILSVSAFAINSILGFMMCIAIALALYSVFLLLPLILLVVDDRQVANQ
ncbi:efflux RND transporter permease subunit [Aurantivibrio plasticivorans]